MADEQKPKERKMVSVMNERTGQFEQYAANPSERTWGEQMKEAFHTTATAVDLRKARKRSGYERD